ncbi:hypothetical protein CTI14_31920 [Methylobacterium radiotolerans]|nr:hypothetical protein CTI14_31920 [Methylobacterium radiotolerans]
MSPRAPGRPSTARPIGAILTELARAPTRARREGAMSPEMRESRAALILLAASVGAVLIFGAFTLLTQLG